MTNPTSNFGWQMPTSTDLVTDLPADFEVFGQAVDTTLVDLKGGTTGQVLAKASNTDMDFVWSADAAGMTNPMTTTGDIIYSSPGSTPVRLGIGTSGQVLNVAAGVPAWTTISSGGMTLISTTTLTGTSTTISSIPQTYQNLQLVITGFVPGTNQVYQALDFYTGSSSSVGGYILYQIDSISTTPTITSGSGKYYTSRTTAPGWSSSSNTTSHSVTDIYDYTRTGVSHVINSTTSYNDGNGTARTSYNFASTNNTGAINAINVTTGLGNTITGTAYLYGVK